LKRVVLLLVSICIIIVSIFVFTTEKKSTETIDNNEVFEDSLSFSKGSKLFYLYPKFTENQIVYHKIYTLSYSEKDEQAAWVAYKLDKNSINDSIKRKDNFREDPSISTGSATLNDYLNSGYDRGHLAPAKAMSFNKVTMSESFFMSNMSPQVPSFNRGIWKKLEEEVRGWIGISDSLYVVTGPVLDNPKGTIGYQNVTVPRAYYKTMLRFNNNTITAIGFLLNNEKSDKTISAFVTSIDSIEKITQLDFFQQLPDSIETVLENNTNLKIFLKN
jgi:endonuclease G, mitochondrial